MGIYGQNVQYIKSKLLSKYDDIISHGITIRGTDFMHKDNLTQIEQLTGLSVVATVEKDAKSIKIGENELEGLFK